MGFLIKIYGQVYNAFSKLRLLLKDLYSFIFVKIFSIVLLLLNIFLWIFAYLMYQKSVQDTVILHYNVDFGIDLIGSKANFFVVPALSLFFIILNKIILLLLLKKNDFKFWAYFMLSFLSLFHAFLLMSAFSIYLINF